MVGASQVEEDAIGEFLIIKSHWDGMDHGDK